MGGARNIHTCISTHSPQHTQSTPIRISSKRHTRPLEQRCTNLATIFALVCAEKGGHRLTEAAKLKMHFLNVTNVSK